jgi:hypothetical protein
MKRLVAVLPFAFLVVACAAGERAPKSAESMPSQAPPSATSMQPGYPSGSMATTPAPQASPGYPQPPPPVAPGGGAMPRSMALTNAQNDVESSQRELDPNLANNDCKNACRALGSMDRAAGRLCGLVQSDEMRRCDDAKEKVYSARDRVKRTCKACDDGTSVDRKDPVPASR